MHFMMTNIFTECIFLVVIFHSLNRNKTSCRRYKDQSIFLFGLANILLLKIFGQLHIFVFKEKYKRKKINAKPVLIRTHENQGVCVYSFYFLTSTLHDFRPILKIALEEDCMISLLLGYLTYSFSNYW